MIIKDNLLRLRGLDFGTAPTYLPPPMIDSSGMQICPDGSRVGILQQCPPAPSAVVRQQSFWDFWAGPVAGAAAVGVATLVYFSFKKGPR